MTDGWTPAQYRIEIPMRLPSVSNLREHWRAKACRTRAQRATVRVIVLTELGRSWNPMPLARPSDRVCVSLCRVSPRALDDDNLRGALKACRDGIADVLGVNDRDPRIEWKYAQERGKPKEHKVVVIVERIEQEEAKP